jgi:uncharacterized hydrophobic protein (TIGR00271 family)
MVSDQVAVGRESIRQSAGFDRPFVMSNLAATVIACAGLLGDSSATVIGAMLVATLMSPIMGIGLALVDFDNRLLRRSLLTLVGGVTLVLAIGVLFDRIAPEVAPTQQMLDRTAPRMLDLIVALASGAIGAYAVTSSRLSAAVVGVSIAVALVPPLATAGIFLSRAQWPLAQGALLLAFVNMVAIQVGASIALKACGYGEHAGRGSATLAAFLRREAVSLLLMIALVAMLGMHGVRLYAQQRYETRVRETLQAALSSRPEARLNEVSFATFDGRAVVTAVVRSPERFTRAEVGLLGKRLPLAPDGSVPQLRLRHVEVEVVAGGD